MKRKGTLKTKEQITSGVREQEKDTEEKEHSVGD